ncbi:hypothetical protein HID58_059862 [Brassica napus]|uniref:Uncharacterized protein n=1 Tax=Brassica napus TaxID=3708 RepID=A0ABQ7ZU45_BRANA|nr:hypothetical protein HID58_059862 [Brassica napus]
MKGNQKGVHNERCRQSLRIRKPDPIAKKPEPIVHKSSKKSRPVREPVRTPSCVVPTIGEQIMLARIIDEEREYDRQGSPSDTWNYWLNLYELDQAARGVLPKNKDKEKVTFAEGSSSNSERILEFMGEGFVGLHVTVETKLEALGSRMSHIEKNQRLLRRRAKKMEDKLTSIESKVQPSHGEDMDFRQWDYGKKDEEEGEEKEADDNAQQEGEKEKENSEADEQDKEDSDSESESETDELKQLKERRKHDEEEGEEKEAETSDEEKENSEDDEKVEEKVVESDAEGEDDQAETKETPKDNHNEPKVETNRTDETPTPPRGNQTEGTPTPPRGRTKEMAARRLVTRPMEEEPGKGVEVVAEEAVETEEKNSKKVAEEEKKRKRPLGKLLRNILRKKSKGGSWSFTRKHRVLGSCIGARRMPLLLYLRRVTNQRGNHSGCRLLSRRGRSVKQSLRVWKTKFTGVTMPKNE